jgi:hypothetical protein
MDMEQGLQGHWGSRMGIVRKQSSLDVVNIMGVMNEVDICI